MSAFTGELTITEVTWRVWRLEQDLVFEVGHEGSGRRIVVPKGFMTDGASVPQALWSLLPTWGRYSRAAVIHDYLCFLITKGQPHPEAPTRQEADDIFREAMRVVGTGTITRFILYWGAVVGARTPGRPNIVSRVNPLP